METVTAFTLALFIGYAADIAFADPEWLPHPVRIYGWIIQKGEGALNNDRFRFVKGMLMSLVLVGTVFFVFLAIDKLFPYQYKVIKIIWDSLFVYLGIANQTLIREVVKVFSCLHKGLGPARKQLGQIVGRDTAKLNGQQIRLAALESLSENLSDGVIAPLFFYAILGVPGIMAYKMVNTLDSMIGYRNERYEQFGKFAAIMDDMLNFVPARLTVFYMILSAANVRGLRFAIRYGRCHKSPNSGYPEATLAGILDCRFGGPNYYNGSLVDKPYIGHNDKAITDKDLHRAVRINHLSTILCIASIIMVKLLF